MEGNGNRGREMMTDTGEVGAAQLPEPEPATPAGRMRLATVAVADQLRIIRELTSDEAFDAERALEAAYQRACAELLTDEDVQVEGDGARAREFKKRSAWRKLARLFRISVTEPRIVSGRWIDVDGGDAYFDARVECIATAPWGQSVFGLGACTTREMRFQLRGLACPRCGGAMFDNRNNDSWNSDFRCKDRGCGFEVLPGTYDPAEVGSRPNPNIMQKAEHDCIATAATRAINRGVSDLIAAGEVSAEEVTADGTPSDANGSAERRPSRPSVAFVDTRAWGKKADGMTWRELAAAKPDQVHWWIQNGEKITDAQRAELRALLDAQGAPGPEPGPGPGEPADAAPAAGKGRPTIPANEGPPATAEQLAEIAMLMRRKVMNPAARASMEAEVKAGIRVPRAERAIEWLNGRQDIPREPGTDDVDDDPWGDLAAEDRAGDDAWEHQGTYRRAD